jgi:tetratricopeptide (TPR) repeat protein
LAENDYEQALKLEPSQAARYMLHHNRGITRIFQKNRRAKGLEDLKEAAGRFPLKHEAHASLALAYQLDGQMDAAGKHLDTAIAVVAQQVMQGDLKPEKLAQLHYSRAGLYLQHSGQEATVRKTGESALLLGDNQPLRALTGLPLQRPDREGALRHLKEAARLAENDHALRARAEAHRGRVLQLLEQYEDALAAYDEALAAYDQGWKGDLEEALKAGPLRLDVLRWRGEVLLAAGLRLEGDDKPFLISGNYREAVLRNYREAAVAFGEYVDNGGAPSAAVYLQLGLARAKLDEHRKAIDEYCRALDVKPTDKEKARLYLYRGQEYLTISAYLLALDDFENLLQLEPENPDAYLGRAHAHVRLGDPNAPYNAIQDAERALNGQPKAPRLWLGAARIYALAAARLESEPGQAKKQTTIRLYEDWAEKRLRYALLLVPAEQRPAWRDYVLKDKALYPIGSRLFGPFNRANR